MNSVVLSTSPAVVEGLRLMVEEALGAHEYVHTFVEVEVCLLIIALARRAPDRKEWFPRGQWSTIQSLESKVNAILDPTFKGAS